MTDDPRLPADLALLETFRVKAVIDFIKWTDDDGTTPGGLLRDRFGEKAKQLGKRWTLHDLRLPDLKKIPPEVHSKPLDALELSVDFYPRMGRALSEQALLQALGECQEMLSRRLAPWQAEGVGERIFRVEGAGAVQTGKKHLAKDIEVKTHPGLGTPFATGWHDAVPPSLPRRTPTGVWSTTIYYGHDPRFAGTLTTGHSGNKATEANLTDPQAQIRLYVKTYDRSAPIAKQADWRTRMEVTFNRAALLAQGRSSINVVGDLLRPCLRPLVNKYLKLTVGQVDQKSIVQMRKATGGRKKLPPVQQAIRADVASRAAREALRAQVAGSLTVGPADNTTYKAAARLNRKIGEAAGQFHRAWKAASAGSGKV